MELSKREHITLELLKSMLPTASDYESIADDAYSIADRFIANEIEHVRHLSRVEYSVDEVSIFELGLPVPVASSLVNANIVKIGDLLRASKNDLVNSMHISIAALNDILVLLDKIGWQIGMDEDEVDRCVVELKKGKRINSHGRFV